MDIKDMDLNQLRQQIDVGDKMIAELFVKRMQLVDAVAVYKQKNNIATLDASREQAVLDRVAELTGEFAPYAQELFKAMMALSRDYQDEQRKGK